MFVQDKYLRDGLGQLTDGDVGETNFRLDTKKMGIKGYEWVGWKNDSMSNEPVSILFKFDSVRNFSQVYQLYLFFFFFLNNLNIVFQSGV